MAARNIGFGMKAMATLFFIGMAPAWWLLTMVMGTLSLAKAVLFTVLDIWTDVR